MQKTICQCDICGAENAKTYTMPTYRTFDSCDGKTFFKEPQLTLNKIDLCDKCALKATNIHEIGVMEQKYVINPQKGGK